MVGVVGGLVWLVCVVDYACLVLFRCVVDWCDWLVCFLVTVYGFVWYLVVCGLHCLRVWRLFSVDGACCVCLVFGFLLLFVGCWSRVVTLFGLLWLITLVCVIFGLRVSLAC